MSAPAVVLQEVTKRFGARAALQELTAEVACGKTVVLWGPNGAGKTTALRCILGVVPFEGAIRVMGHDVAREGKAARQLVGYVPQEFGLDGSATVGELLRFYARLRGVSPPQVLQVVEAWRLSDLVSQRVRTLSGGMKQRLAIAIALLGDPPILLLDEPTSHLDATTRRDFEALVERLQHQGKTLVVCSHRRTDALRWADWIIVLEQGRPRAAGTLAEVQPHLRDTAVLGLVVPEAEHARAMEVLGAHGIRAQMSGPEGA